MTYHVSAYFEFPDYHIVYCQMKTYPNQNGNSEKNVVMNGDIISPRRLRSSREKGVKVC